MMRAPATSPLLDELAEVIATLGDKRDAAAILTSGSEPDRMWGRREAYHVAVELIGAVMVRLRSQLDNPGVL